MFEARARRLGVFLCHSSRDQSIARELYRQLKSENWMDVWFIEASLLPSQDWDVEISSAVRSTDVLVILHSKNATGLKESPYPSAAFALDILQHRSKKSIPIIVLRLDDDLLPGHLKIWWLTDYFPKHQRKLALQSLLNQLKVLAQGQHVSVERGTLRPRTEKFLMWSPSNWKNLLFESRNEVDDEYSSSDDVRLHQKTGLKILHRKSNMQAELRIVSGLLLLILFGLVKNYLLLHEPLQHPITIPPPAVTLIPEIGSVRSSSKDGMKTVYVPNGEFRMGGDVYYDEKPIHTVILTAFWMDQTEVTNVMFADFLSEEGNREEDGVPWMDSSDADAHIHLERDAWQADPGYEDHPVVEVTWYGANAYCSWAGRRLPTEAEWEKAARGEDGRIYPWGNDAPAPDLLNFDDHMGDTTRAGNYPQGSSPYGALDMAGNAWEWVADRYSRTYYADSPTDNPKGPDTGFFRVLRGGAWKYGRTYARSVHRNRGVPIISHDFIGFRCASSE
jgi:formylglycine-generating enzyme required for sulfatase activity